MTFHDSQKLKRRTLLEGHGSVSLLLIDLVDMSKLLSFSSKLVAMNICHTMRKQIYKYIAFFHKVIHVYLHFLFVSVALFLSFFITLHIAWRNIFNMSFFYFHL